VSVLWWIMVSGLAISALALVGVWQYSCPSECSKRVALPLVAVAAGALLGGALFHMLPESVRVLGNNLAVYAWVAAGLFSFHVLEQFLHWHHRPVGAHRPLGYLVADGLHNLIGGLAVGGAFMVDVRLGLVTWLAGAAHEVPQEFGDFGILIQSGWSARHAVAYNLASALTFPLGGLIAYAVAGEVTSTWRSWCRSLPATSSTSRSQICCPRSPHPRFQRKRPCTSPVSRWAWQCC
jgi:zinc and cadmium transporter